VSRSVILEGCKGVVKCNVSIAQITESDARKMRCGNAILEILQVEKDASANWPHSHSILQVVCKQAFRWFMDVRFSELSAAPQRTPLPSRTSDLFVTPIGWIWNSGAG
jgi:hypothetical protein